MFSETMFLHKKMWGHWPPHRDQSFMIWL